MRQSDYSRHNQKAKNSLHRYILQVLNIGKRTSTGIGKNVGGIATSLSMQHLPDIVANPIQDLDSTSPTFGEFYYMADYE